MSAFTFKRRVIFRDDTYDVLTHLDYANTTMGCWMKVGHFRPKLFGFIPLPMEVIMAEDYMTLGNAKELGHAFTMLRMAKEVACCECSPEVEEIYGNQNAPPPP